MKKTTKFLLLALLAIGITGCKHFEKKAPCDFAGFNSENQSTKEDKTK